MHAESFQCLRHWTYIFGRICQTWWGGLWEGCHFPARLQFKRAGEQVEAQKNRAASRYVASNKGNGESHEEENHDEIFNHFVPEYNNTMFLLTADGGEAVYEILVQAILPDRVIQMVTRCKRGLSIRRPALQVGKRPFLHGNRWQNLS